LLRTFSDFCQEFIVQMADAEMKESPAPVVETVKIKKDFSGDLKATLPEATLLAQVRGVTREFEPGIWSPPVAHV
jgi:hypothetical protein